MVAFREEREEERYVIQSIKEKGIEGQQVSSLLLKEMPLAVYGFKKGIFD